MDKKQKEELRILLKSRKRAQKVLAQRREVEQKRLEYKMQKEANQELIKKYTEELNTLAQECGIQTLAEQAAHERSGSLLKRVSYYIYFGPGIDFFRHSLEFEEYGELRASHLSIRILWKQPDHEWVEVEIRVHKNGQITFHNSIFPVFPFIWRQNPKLLNKMLVNALQHPRPATEPLPRNA